MERDGNVITFYSYKGGVGRSFALANVASVLARWGLSVLTVDWDLEAPGLSHYFGDHAEPAETSLLDVIRSISRGGDQDADPAVVRLPDCAGSLRLLPAARGDDPDYVHDLQQVDWARLYADHDLGGHLERWREEWRRSYDVVLIDSRTGITDIGGICTAQMPDLLVMCLTANEQNLRGTVDVAARARRTRNGLPYDRGGLPIVPLVCRFDAREEYARAREWRARLSDGLGHLYDNWTPRDVTATDMIEHCTVPYLSYWSFGESLPVLEESTSSPEYVTYHIETLAALLMSELSDARLLIDSRDSYVARAKRAASKHARDGYDVYVSYSQADAEVAREVVAALRARGLEVYRPGEVERPGHPWPDQLQDALDRSASMLFLIGEESSTSQWQGGELQTFMQQAIVDVDDRPVFPVLAPESGPADAPRLVSRHQMFDLGRDDPAALAADIAQQLSAEFGQSAQSGRWR